MQGRRRIHEDRAVVNPIADADLALRATASISVAARSGLCKLDAMESNPQALIQQPTHRSAEEAPEGTS
jgi:hypothetical protein